MQVTVRGWARDMGSRTLLKEELAFADVSEERTGWLDKGTTYFKLDRSVWELPGGHRKVDYTARIFAHAELNMNGSYLVQLELNRADVTRLFYLMNGDRALPELLETFSAFKLLEAVGRSSRRPATAKPVIEDSEPADLAFNPAFLKKVRELEFLPQTRARLENNKIIYIGDLVQLTEANLLRMPNMGRKALNEIKEVLVQMGLHLGMEIPGWPPENIEKLAKRFEDQY